jgi:hypothetical protein
MIADRSAKRGMQCLMTTTGPAGWLAIDRCLMI